jgi:hypothetical protein
MQVALHPEQLATEAASAETTASKAAIASADESFMLSILFEMGNFSGRIVAAALRRPRCSVLIDNLS